MITARYLKKILEEVPDDSLIFIPTLEGTELLMFPLNTIDLLDSTEELEKVMGDDKVEYVVDYENETGLNNLAKTMQSPILVLTPFNKEDINEC